VGGQRALAWLIAPASSIFAASLSQLAFFAFLLVYEFGWSLITLMLNGQRLESDLLATQAELRASVAGLE
jgi:hypothetical protein